MLKEIKGVYFDFGYVIGYPISNIDREYLYLDWNGVKSMIEDAQISQYLRSGVGLKELTAFFKKEIYEVFVRQ